LGKGQGVAVVECAGGTAHVLLPGIASAFSAAACLFFATKGASDFCTGCSNVAVDDSAVTAERTYPLEEVLDVLSEEGGGKTLGHFVVVLDCLFEGFEFEHIDNGCKNLILHNWGVVVDGDDGGLDVVARASDHFSTAEDLTSLLLNFNEAIYVLLDATLGM
jgi:hypothetical protein